MNINRVLNLQATIQHVWPEMQSAYSVTIAQQAEIELLACLDDGADPYIGIYEAVCNMLPAAIAVDCALLTLIILDADRQWQESSR